MPNDPCVCPRCHQVKPSLERRCLECCESFIAKRSDQYYCSPACRQRSYRATLRYRSRKSDNVSLEGSALSDIVEA